MHSQVWDLFSGIILIVFIIGSMPVVQEENPISVIHELCCYPEISHAVFWLKNIYICQQVPALHLSEG